MGPLNKQVNLYICFIAAVLAAGCSGRLPQAHYPPQVFLEAPAIENLPLPRRIVVGRAVESIGSNYTWGGASPAIGFDCSGLVVYTHAAAGVTTPRTARDMFDGGRLVSDLIQPGDLVFFNSPGKRYSVHVGIFIGQNTFVHAPGRGKKVRQASLGNPYFSRHFIGAKTFL